MTLLALGGWLVFLLLAFVGRTVMQYVTTGKTGFVGFHGRPGSVEWWGGALFTMSVLGCPLACLLDLWGLLTRCSYLEGQTFVVVGLVAYGVGLLGTLWAQVTMGASWRIGVDPEARTQLVVTGPFAQVRNPIFSCMMVLAVGLTLLVPNVVSVLSLLVLFIGVEIQVRLVEEPYLRSVHGDSYVRYATHTGRFVPGLGLLSK